MCLQSSRTFVVQERGLKGQSRRNFRHRKQCTKKKTFSLSISFKTTNASQNKRWGNTQTFPSNMLINELELSYRWNSGWHCKKMVSYFVSKSTYFNHWFGKFFFSLHHRHVLSTGIVRTRHLQKLYVSLKETLIQRSDWFTYFVKKKNKCSKWPKISHDGSFSKTSSC